MRYLIYLVLANPLLSYAAEEAAHHGGGWNSFLFKLVNFVVFVLLLYKFSKKPLAEALKRRRLNVERRLKEAKEAERRARELLREYEEKVKNVEKEMEEIKRRYIEEGEKEKERIIEEAKREVERIRKEAEELITQEFKKAEEALRAKSVDIAVSLAMEILKRETREDDHKRLSEEFLKLLEVKS